MKKKLAVLTTVVVVLALVGYFFLPGLLVKWAMESESVRSQIKEAVDAALSPAIARLGDKLKADRDVLVLNLPNLGRWAQVQKADMRELNRFLDDNAERLLESEAPVVLTVPIGKAFYHPVMFEAYHSKLRQKLGNQFRYVHIADTRGRFLGLVPVEQFMPALSEDSKLLELINGSDAGSMSVYLEHKFGPDVLKRISIDKEVREVLSNTITSGLPPCAGVTVRRLHTNPSKIALKPCSPSDSHCRPL